MATRQKADRRSFDNDPNTWITIPEFNVLPEDVGWQGFDHHVFSPQIGTSIQGSIWSIIWSMRDKATRRFASLADLMAANARVCFDRKRRDASTDDEWFAYGYVNVFDLLERWFLTQPVNPRNESTKLDGSVLLAQVAEVILDMYGSGPHDPKSLGELRSQFAKKGAATMLAKSPKQQEKQLVRECWDEWQKDSSRYKSKEAFADDMRQKYLNLKSQRGITRWCLEWERETD